MNIPGLSLLVLAIGAEPLVDGQLAVVNVCNVHADQDRLLNKSIQLDAIAEAGGHLYEVVLSDVSCPHQHLPLSIPDELEGDDGVRTMMHKLYPGLPNNDGFSDAKVPVRVSGTLKLYNYRGVVKLFLRIERLEGVSEAAE